MKAALAFLTDVETFHFVSQIAWRLHLEYRTGVGARRLPPHVSLKQPFEIENLDALEAFMAGFAQSIDPFRIELGAFQLWEGPESGVLSLAIQATPALRDLHSRLNRELAERFGERRADFDGDAYTFHLTIAAGGGSVQAYRQAFAACSHSPFIPPIAFETRELALFVYENDGGRDDWQYLCYKIFPLGLRDSAEVESK